MAKYERYNNEQAYQTLLFDTKLTHPPPGLVPKHTRNAGLGDASSTTHASSHYSAKQPASEAAIEAAITHYLSREPGNDALLTKVGIYLRARGLTPPDSLKRFILQRPHKFVYLDLGDGSNRVQLLTTRSTTSSEVPPGLVPPGSNGANGLSYTNANVASSADGPLVGIPDDIDPSAIERHLVLFIASRSPNSPANRPMLGESIIKHLGFSMKGILARFLIERPHLFVLPDDGRQHVLLAPGALDAVGLNALSGLPTEEDLLADIDYHRPQPSVSGRASTISGDVAAAATTTMPFHNAKHPYRPPQYGTWDRLTQVIYDFVASQGGSTPFRAVDEYVHEEHEDLLRESGFLNPANWVAKSFSYNRRNIFRKDGACMAILTEIWKGSKCVVERRNGRDERNGMEGDALAHLQETLPPLPALPPPATQGKLDDNQNDNKAEEDHANANGVLDLSDFPALCPAPAPQQDNSDQPASDDAVALHGSTTDTKREMVGQLAEERRALESLRDEINDSLNALRPLCELQNENASLRAACITLGREMLSLKQEVEEIKRSVAATAIEEVAHAVAARARDGPPNAAAAAASTYAASSQTEEHASSQSTDSFFLHSLAAPLSTTPRGTGGGSNDASSGMPRVVVIGGHDGACWLDTVECFDPETPDKWRSLPSLPEPRSFGTAVWSNKGIFLLGGGNGVEWYDSVLLLPNGGDTWQSLPPLRLPRGSLGAGIVDDSIYAFGGGKPNQQYADVEIYDLGQNTWLDGPSLGTKRFAGAGASLDGAVYAVGGFDGVKYLTSVERLDPREGRWTQVASMKHPRGGHACAAAPHQGLLYAVGGYYDAALETCEVYDARTDSWRQIESMQGPRAYGAAAVSGSNGDVYALGGLRSDMATHAPLVEKYTRSVPGNGGIKPTSQWEAGAALPLGVNPRRSFLAACTMMVRG